MLNVLKSNNLEAYEKEYSRLSGYERIIREDHQNCHDKPSTCKKRWETFFCKIRVIVEAGIPPYITEETICRVLPKTDLKWTYFQRKGILTKNDLKWTLKFSRKVCRKRAMCKYEI